MKFRYDINGLRALATVGVLFFHAGVETFYGGFLGVDVFFVISGFLITSNIIKEVDSDSFSLKVFYDKRARRILPALTFTMLITTLLAFYFMLPYDLKNYGQSLFATSFGANNILLYLTSGYWSLASEFKPLYHMWSLGVEEQYYFIIPILFVLLYGNVSFRKTIFILFLISWMISLYTVNKEFDFLIITNRFWELCTGTLLALYYSRFKFKSDILSFIGVCMIVFSYILPFYFSEKQAIYSLVPVIGTVLIIVFSKPYGYINRFFSQKIIFYFGLSSYSVYLLHQPILSFLRLSHEGKTPVSSEVFFVLLSIPLGILMWKFIEVPMRNPKKISNKLFYSLILTCILSLSSLGFMMHKSYGFQYASWNSKYSYGVNPQDYADTPYKLQSDSFQTDKPKMLIIGNSFARDFLNVLTESEVTTGYEVVYLFSYYADLTVSRNLASNADVVFFVSSAGKSNRMEDEVDLLERTLKVKVELDNFVAGDYYFVGTKNYGYNNNFTKIFDWDKSKNYLVNINKSSIDANNIQSEIFREKYIDLLSLTRNRDKTRLFTDGHKFISFDTNHITKDGAVYLGGLLLQNEIISEILLKP
ncbi:acyltransferase family protein [Vibrio cyclitrophicus]|uniref:acyltransferase family protein n=1 Tax=Vibrio cyclitrophicus TaxID=47951 RepID=UPI000C828646|nr:acyltransferase [Vibrio cyclitrophicus]PMF60822.1 hypothetical protein BCV09_18130 [Vibrio cyclitrophicus]PMH17155.1 hypothetical protein BCU73_07640 [Vibrio cyclitrophicus]